MKAEDIQRIDGLLIKICETINGRSPESIFANSPKGFDAVLNLPDEDLKYLEQQGAVTIKTPEELIAEYGVKPEEYGQLTKRSRSFFDEWGRLDEETGQLKKRLSWPYKLLSRRNTLPQREQGLIQKEEQIDSVKSSIHKLSTAYSAVARYVLTDKGVYVSLKPEIKRYVDLGFQPMQRRSSNNSLNGQIILFHHEGGDIWDEEACYTPVQYGEAFKLNVHIPYEELTGVKSDRTILETEFEKNVTGRTKRCIDTFVKGRSGPIGGGDYLDFHDRRFWVMIHPTSANVHKDEKNKIGTTNVTDYVSDFGPQGYHHESRTVDLYVRIVEGEFKFDLTFDRVNSSGQSFRR